MLFLAISLLVGEGGAPQCTGSALHRLQPPSSLITAALCSELILFNTLHTTALMMGTGGPQVLYMSGVRFEHPSRRPCSLAYDPQCTWRSAVEALELAGAYLHCYLLHLLALATC